jgi:hypothetical protein
MVDERGNTIIQLHKYGNFIVSLKGERFAVEMIPELKRTGSLSYALLCLLKGMGHDLSKTRIVLGDSEEAFTLDGWMTAITALRALKWRPEK